MRKLKKIKGTEIQKIFSPVNPNGFYIDVEVTDNQLLPLLQKGIVDAFEKSDYIKKRLEYKRTRLKELINKLEIEVKKIDSTKQNLENIIKGKEKPSSSLIVDGSSISRQLVELNDKLYQLKEELNFTTGCKSYKVLQHFINPPIQNWQYSY